MRNFIFFFVIIFSNNSISDEKMNCKTVRQSGLSFIGKDYLRIIEYFGLDDFSIILSRNRDDIVKNQLDQNKEKGKIKRIKNVHFIELILVKSNGYPLVFYCSWRHKIGSDRIIDNNFECIEQKEKKDLFSLDYNSQFSYSSAFKISKNKTNTLHSLFGKCKVSKDYISK
tara:strand:- start:583 stop:1092 length:510 start_codon:yes stop_codon:yes gene_type:complete